MPRRRALCLGFLLLLAATDPLADQGGTLSPRSTAASTTDSRNFPGTLASGHLPDEYLLSMIANWISESVGIPASEELPLVRLALPADLAALRWTGSLPAPSGHPSGDEDTAPAGLATDVMALYNDTTQTIHLQADWTGHTPGELSILVHEMVHHLQNRAGLAYECPAAREKAAYAAQQQWLELFGQGLEVEFSIDPMTLLIRGTCST